MRPDELDDTDEDNPPKLPVLPSLGKGEDNGVTNWDPGELVPFANMIELFIFKLVIEVEEPDRLTEFENESTDSLDALGVFGTEERLLPPGVDTASKDPEFEGGMGIVSDSDLLTPLVLGVDEESLRFEVEEFSTNVDALFLSSFKELALLLVSIADDATKDIWLLDSLSSDSFDCILSS